MILKTLIILLALSLLPIVNAQGHFPPDALHEYRQKFKQAQQEKQRTIEELRWTEEQEQQNNYFQIQIASAQDILDPRIETNCMAKSGCD